MSLSDFDHVSTDRGEVECRCACVSCRHGYHGRCIWECDNAPTPDREDPPASARFQAVLDATAGQRHALDGRAVEIAEVFRDNAEEEFAISDEQLAAIARLNVGESANIGWGGAFGLSTLRRIL